MRTSDGEVTIPSSRTESVLAGPTTAEIMAQLDDVAVKVRALQAWNRSLRAALQDMVDTCGKHVEECWTVKDFPEAYEVIDRARVLLEEGEPG